MSWMTRIAHELEEVGLVTLYFLFCFGMILTLKKLFLADYEIKSYALGSAVISALIAAKIVVILDKTRTGTRFDRSQPTGIAAGYKTLLYMAVAALVLFGEHMFHAYREFGALGKALEEIWEHRNRNEIIAKALCIGLTFAAYHVYAGVDRRLGSGILWRALWSRPQSVQEESDGSPEVSHEPTRAR